MSLIVQMGADFRWYVRETSGSARVLAVCASETRAHQIKRRIETGKPVAFRNFGELTFSRQALSVGGEGERDA